MTKALNLQQAVGRKCAYCGIVMRSKGHSRPTRDHCIPKVQGGTFCNGNRVICCLRCNQDKSSLTLSEWLAALEAQNDPRVTPLKSYMSAPIVGWNAPHIVAPVGLGCQ